jgi:hypothetical protein
MTSSSFGGMSEFKRKGTPGEWRRIGHGREFYAAPNAQLNCAEDGWGGATAHEAFHEQSERIALSDIVDGISFANANERKNDVSLE